MAQVGERGPSGEVKESKQVGYSAPPAAVADIETTGRIQAASVGLWLKKQYVVLNSCIVVYTLVVYNHIQ